MTKTKSKKFGTAVPESPADYHRRKLATELSFRNKRILDLLAAIPRTSDIDQLVSYLEEMNEHTTGWLRFAHAIQKIKKENDTRARFDADQAKHSNPAPVHPLDEQMEDETHHGMEGL